MVRRTIGRGRSAIPRSTTPRRIAGSIPPRSCRTRSSPAQATDGNSPRNLLEGPGFKVVDLAVSRNFKLRGTSTLTFRAEATNAFNIINYGQPGNTVPSGATSTTFGIIRTANAMRRLQLGVRLSF